MAPAHALGNSDISACLDVLAKAATLPHDHPHAKALRAAAGRLLKPPKSKVINRARRKARRGSAASAASAATAASSATSRSSSVHPTHTLPRPGTPNASHDSSPAPPDPLHRHLSAAEKMAADQATVNATVTGSRLDDETDGLTGVPGTLYNARKCYVCSHSYTAVHHFYYALCPPCAALNYAKRDARADLRGRRALVTGGRAKIGMYVVLMLLRDGAHVTMTTRFPADAVRRFARFPDASEWMGRLEIVGIDLRDPRQVLRLASLATASGPIDILINNAAQTIRRSAEAYAPLMRAEEEGLPVGEHTPRVHILGRFNAPVPSGPCALPAQEAEPKPAALDAAPAEATPASSAVAHISDRNTTLALAPNSRPDDADRIDAGGLLPDLAPANTWSNSVGSIPALEILEVSLCNAIAPTLLVNALRPSLAASPHARTYIVNVSAAEGQFNHFKTPGHAHTNMQKAGLNMLTRTAAAEMFAADGILMTSADTGWVTDERPWPARIEAWEQGFRCPLDLVDGAARIYDPIVRGEAGEDVYGVLLKDYKVAKW
ncbi:hypothetical protein Q8F55_007363 [Vanrija albida]|uniref:Oxidoreductase n=1 Tax=Vanrija albida TaxID=181172 RepID=A0ABR3PU84_9TREE